MAVTFDTLKAATRLREQADFSEKQAAALVETFADGIVGNLATREDLAKTEQALRGDLEKSEQALRNDLEKTEQALRTDMAKTEQGVARRPGPQHRLAEKRNAQAGAPHDPAPRHRHGRRRRRHRRLRQALLTLRRHLFNASTVLVTISRISAADTLGIFSK